MLSFASPILMTMIDFQASQKYHFWIILESKSECLPSPYLELGRRFFYLCFFLYRHEGYHSNFVPSKLPQQVVVLNLTPVICTKDDWS